MLPTSNTLLASRVTWDNIVLTSVKSREIIRVNHSLARRTTRNGGNMTWIFMAALGAVAVAIEAVKRRLRERQV